MANIQYPNRDWLQMKYDQRLTDALDFIMQGLSHVSTKTGATLSGSTVPPPSIAALNVAKTSSGHLQAVIQDFSPAQWGIHYFLEHSTTSNFAQPHVIHLGQSRTWVGPDISSEFPYWRAYSMYPGQTEASVKVYHQGAIITSPVLPSTGSGTAAGNGRTGGVGFGLTQIRPNPQSTTGAQASGQRR